MVSCQNVCCAVVVLVLAFLINVLYKIGEIQFLFPKNVRTCTRIEGYHGCEDFAFFRSNANVYMSCDDRSWLRYQSVAEHNLSTRLAQQQQKKGSLYLLPANNYEKPLKIRLPTNLQKTGVNDFHPLGIATLEDKSGQWLYVTNTNRDGVQQMYIFQVKGPAKLQLFATIEFAEPFQMLNDVIVVPESGGAFYTTVWLVHEPGSWMNFFDVYGSIYLGQAVTYVLFCEPPTKQFLQQTANRGSNTRWHCRKVVENLKMANGITQSWDSTRIYVAQSLGRVMSIYSRNPHSNDLTLVKHVPTVAGCDNLELSMDDDMNSLYLGCHPKPLTFQLHASYPQQIVAPSRILRYNDTHSDEDKMEIVLESVGEYLTGSSLGIKLNGHLLVGSVHDECYLLCKDFHA